MVGCLEKEVLSRHDIHDDHKIPPQLQNQVFKVFKAIQYVSL